MSSKITLLLLLTLLTVLHVNAQPTAFTTCPNANVAVVRSSGSSSNPVSIYDVNSTTGASTLLSGPILDPSSASTNLQINGIGLNEVDGFMYGMFSDEPATLSTVPTTPYYRLGANAQAVQLGTLTGPPFTAGDNGSFVIPNAGEFNQTGTYYFPAVTGFVAINLINLPASTFTPSNFYIGVLTGSDLLTAGTGGLSPTYITITNPSNDAAGYLAASSVTITATNAQGLGLQDFIYNNADGNLYTYVSYSNGSGGFFGQMLMINPSTGILSAIAPPVVQPFLTSSVFPNGMLVDGMGHFLIMMTDGSMYRADGTPANYTGTITLLNATSGLPASVTGDMASCGMITIPLPNQSLEFTLTKKDEYVDVQLFVQDETNIHSYDIEYSTNGTDFVSVGRLFAEGKMSYSFLHPNYFTSSFNYYRIKATDFIGKTSFSEIRSIHIRGGQELSFYPNPVRNGEISVKFPEKWLDKKVSLALVNQIGQTVFQKEITQVNFIEKISLGEKRLPNGVYFLSVKSHGRMIAAKKLQILK